MDFSTNRPANRPAPPEARCHRADQKAAYKAAEDKWNVSLGAALQKLSPESLENYDGVLFASTTGDLPFPTRRVF